MYVKKNKTKKLENKKEVKWVTNVLWNDMEHIYLAHFSKQDSSICKRFNIHKFPVITLIYDQQ